MASVCRKLREHVDVPIIMLTARTEEADRVLGLEGGADDYVSKPFSARELVARIRSQARRIRGKSSPVAQRIELGSLVVDPTTMTVTFEGNELQLTTHEFQLLRALTERPGRVFTRERLLELTQGTSADAFDRSIDVLVSRLRVKLGDDARNPTLLKTVRGVGYVWAYAVR
ncbi:MAG: response regulator transcription factor [Polyangiales bacterium]